MCESPLATAGPCGSPLSLPHLPLSPSPVHVSPLCTPQMRSCVRASRSSCRCTRSQLMQRLLDSTQLTTDDGQLLRRRCLEIGAVNFPAGVHGRTQSHGDGRPAAGARVPADPGHHPQPAALGGSGSAPPATTAPTSTGPRAPGSAQAAPVRNGTSSRPCSNRSRRRSTSPG